MTTALEVRSPASADWTALGCAVRLVVSRDRDLRAARSIAAEDLAAIDLACSRFRADSELVMLARSSGRRPVAISPLLAEAVAAALDAAAVTDGDVDPAVGAAMAELGYDRDFARMELDGLPITVVRRPVPDWRQIELDRGSLTLRVPTGVQLDLGATAKALAADRIVARLEQALDGRGSLVALGGDIALGGEPPSHGWSVRVQDMTGPVGIMPVGPSQVIALRSGGLATSSTSARRWVRGGAVMHHILDPRTGVPVASPWRTVSVAASTCLDANVASTAAIVRGEAAIGWLSSRGLAARLVDIEGNVRTLPGWPEPEPEQERTP